MTTTPPYALQDDPGIRPLADQRPNILSAGWIRSKNFVTGSAGWSIDASGNAEFNSVTVRGAITGSTIDIGGADSTSFHVDVNGNMWLGNATFGSAPFQVASDGSLTVSGTATITGATITGATFQTAASGRRIVINSTSDLGTIQFFTGIVGETAPGSLVSSSSSIPRLTMTGPDAGSGHSSISLGAGALVYSVDITSLNSARVTTSGTFDVTSPFVHLNATNLGFFALGTAATQQTVTGSRGGNAALASLLNALASYNLIVDGTTP